MTSPLVSIVIPTYNCERYIRETVQSILDQTLNDWELVVVDDGSTDNTVEVVRDLDRRIRVLVQTNAGVCVARNRGFEASSGRYLCFMDHDDIWYPEKLARQVGWMERRPELGMVHSDYILWHARDGTFPTPAEMRPIDDADVLDPAFTGWVYHQFMLDSCALTSSAMIRREALETCGLFDVGLPYSEDWDLFLRLSRHYQFAKMHWPSTLYRQHQKQGSRVARPRDYRSELVLRAEKTWGLTGPDGTPVDVRRFRQRIAKFRMEFGRQHLIGGSRRTGVSALLDAWLSDPAHWRYLAQAGAAVLGWTPKS